MRNLLQGIAIGVLLATGLLALVYYTNPEQEVIVKEKEYTVEAAISYLQEQDNEVSKKDAAPDNSEETQSEQTEEVEEDNTEVETESETEDTTGQATEETTEQTEEQVKDYQLVIQSGMNSDDVADLLYANGIVDDAVAFNQYLEQNGYQHVIRTGTYDVNEQMSYQEIAIIITN
ncbi:MltG/YceG/YrrL family protein [Ornithinibacillus californiensis]|uniref:endolytic transglycosylase MltG n=1 Tax=Ornithinibacillus californiensis TaxID=161536 RepID=UPI00069EFEA5|nr:endolytic transglycosylase MltG [Ornithinibacillus californiensis]